MFKQYCEGCTSKEDCFNFAECAREKYRDFTEDNVVEGNQLTELAIKEHQLQMSDVPIFREGSNT